MDEQRPNASRPVSLDGFFHNSWVLGGLAFFWLLGSVVLLVGVIATMKLAYEPTQSKVLGLNKQESLIMVAIAVTVHLVLLFLFLGMVLKEKTYRQGAPEDGDSEGGTNTERSQWVEDVGTNKQKEGDLPPCYDCLVGDETPPPPFHSLILRISNSSNSISTQCQETWPCLSTEYQTPDADKPNLEHVEVDDDAIAYVDHPDYRLDRADAAVIANRRLEEEHNRGDQSVTGNTDLPHIAHNGVSSLETEICSLLNLNHRSAVGIKIPHVACTNLEQSELVQIADIENPNLNPMAMDVGDYKKTGASKRSVEHKLTTKCRTSDASGHSLESSTCVENVTSCEEDSAMQDTNTDEFDCSSDGGTTEQQISDCSGTTQNIERSISTDISKVCCLKEIESRGEGPFDTVLFDSLLTIPLFDSERSVMRQAKYNLDASTATLGPELKFDIGKGKSTYADAESRVNENESEGNLFNTSADEECIHSDCPNSDNRSENDDILNEDGNPSNGKTEPFPGMLTNPRLQIADTSFVRKESIAIGEDGPLGHCNIEDNQDGNYFKTESHNVSCNMHKENDQSESRFKYGESFGKINSSSQEESLLTLGRKQKESGSRLHEPTFARSGIQRSEYAFNTISEGMTRQTKSSGRDFNHEFFTVCNSDWKQRCSRFNRDCEPVHQTSCQLSGESASESVRLTGLPPVARVEFYPIFYSKQMWESRESGIQSCTSLGNSSDLEPFDRTPELSSQDLTLDSAVGSYVSIARQNCGSEPDDKDDSTTMV